MSWKSQFKSIVTLSTKEVKYAIVIKVLWFKGLLCEINELSNHEGVHFDNQRAIHLCKKTSFFFYENISI